MTTIDADAVREAIHECIDSKNAEISGTEDRAQAKVGVLAVLL
jgi:hypothetical protein